jgi:hypothetical protein
MRDMVGNARVLEIVIFLTINVLPPTLDISKKFIFRIIVILIYNIDQIYLSLLIKPYKKETKRVYYYKK